MASIVFKSSVILSWPLVKRCPKGQRDQCLLASPPGRFYDGKEIMQAVMVFAGGSWRILAVEFAERKSGPQWYSHGCPDYCHALHGSSGKFTKHNSQDRVW